VVAAFAADAARVCVVAGLQSRVAGKITPFAGSKIGRKAGSLF